MFRRILISFLIVILFEIPCVATDFFLDLSHDQASGGDGTTMQTDGGADDAFKTFAEAVGSIGTGDVLWIRRIRNVVQVADIAPTQDGTSGSPAIYIGWPRDADSWNCDWVNGSTTVDNIDENDAARETHVGRWITGPDGFDYIITYITDSNTVIIDRPYQGANAANQIVTIKADELPSGVSEPTDTDSWSSDSDGLALIDFNDGNFNVTISGDDHLHFYNLEFLDSSDSNGIVYATADAALFNGCLFKQSASNAYIVRVIDFSAFNRCIFEGSGTSASNQRLEMAADTKIENSAIYNMDGGGAVKASDNLYLKNVNIGVEVANVNYDMILAYGRVFAYDTKLGGTNGYFSLSLGYSRTNVFLRFVNWGKILGKYLEYSYPGYLIENVAVSGETPNKKLSDLVIKITPPTSATTTFKDVLFKTTSFESRKTYDAGTYNVKVWIYNDTGNTLNDTTATDDIMLRCRSEAAGYGDATTEYVSKWYYSDEIDIADAADADDWDYLQADSVVVGVNGAHIYCEVLSSFYDAGADPVYIDPVTVNP